MAALRPQPQTEPCRARLPPGPARDQVAASRCAACGGDALAGQVGLLRWSSASPRSSTCTDHGRGLQSATEGALRSGKRARATHQGLSPLRIVGSSSRSGGIDAVSAPAAAAHSSRPPQGPSMTSCHRGCRSPAPGHSSAVSSGSGHPGGHGSHRRRRRRLLPSAVWLHPSHSPRVLKGWPSARAAGGEEGRPRAV